jgi:hypothetical protein
MRQEGRTASSCKNSASTRERPKAKHKERTAITASSPRHGAQQMVAGDGESAKQRGEVSDGELGLRGATDLVRGCGVQRTGRPTRAEGGRGCHRSGGMRTGSVRFLWDSERQLRALHGAVVARTCGASSASRGSGAGSGMLCGSVGMRMSSSIFVGWLGKIL